MWDSLAFSSSQWLLFCLSLLAKEPFSALDSFPRPRNQITSDLSIFLLISSLPLPARNFLQPSNYFYNSPLHLFQFFSIVFMMWTRQTWTHYSSISLTKALDRGKITSQLLLRKSDFGHLLSLSPAALPPCAER